MPAPPVFGRQAFKIGQMPATTDENIGLPDRIFLNVRHVPWGHSQADDSYVTVHKRHFHHADGALPSR
jgi:hypothetical protein